MSDMTTYLERSFHSTGVQDLREDSKSVHPESHRLDGLFEKVETTAQSVMRQGMELDQKKDLLRRTSHLKHLLYAAKSGHLQKGELQEEFEGLISALGSHQKEQRVLQASRWMLPCYTNSET